MDNMVIDCTVFAAGFMIGFFALKRCINAKYKRLSEEAFNKLGEVSRTYDFHDYKETLCEMKRFLHKRIDVLNFKTNQDNDGSISLSGQTEHLLECMIRFAHRAGCEVSIRGFEECNRMNTKKRNVFVTNFEGAITKKDE